MGFEAPQGARDGLATRGKHWRLWVGSDGVVRAIIEGDHDRASAEAILEALDALAGRVPERPVRFLLYAHRTVRLTPEARDAFAEACRAHVTARIAIVRPSPLARIQARAIERHSGHPFFYAENEREALAALGVPEAAKPPEAPPAPDVGLVDYIS